MKTLAIFLLVPFLMGASQFEKQTPKDWEFLYKRHRDAGHAAVEKGEYADAILKFKTASEGVNFTYVKAGALRNAALCFLLSAKKVGSKSDARDALDLYGKATKLLNKADEICANGCIHRTDCTNTRALTRKHIGQGSGAAKRFLDFLAGKRSDY